MENNITVKSTKHLELQPPTPVMIIFQLKLMQTWFYEKYKC